MVGLLLALTVARSERANPMALAVCGAMLSSVAVGQLSTLTDKGLSKENFVGYMYPAVASFMVAATTTWTLFGSSSQTRLRRMMRPASVISLVATVVASPLPAIVIVVSPPPEGAYLAAFGSGFTGSLLLFVMAVLSTGAMPRRLKVIPAILAFSAMVQAASAFSLIAAHLDLGIGDHLFFYMAYGSASLLIPMFTAATYCVSRWYRLE